MKSLFRWLGRLVLLAALAAAVTVGFLLPDEMIQEWRTRLGFESSTDAQAPVEEARAPLPDTAQAPAPPTSETFAEETVEESVETQAALPYWEQQRGAQEPEVGEGPSYAPSEFRPLTPGAVEAPGAGASVPGTEQRGSQDWITAEEMASRGNYSFRPLAGSTGPAASQGTPQGAIAPQTQRDKLLSAARSAFWKGELDRSIGYYRQLTQEYPEEPDFFGELGNVFREQGEMELAAKAYYDAAVLLANRGETERARGLAEAISSLSSDYTEALREVLSGGQSLATGPGSAVQQ